MQAEMILRSSSLIHAAGFIRWLRSMHRSDAKRAVSLIKETWGVTDTQAKQILTEPATCRVNEETGDVAVTITINAKDLAY